MGNPDSSGYKKKSKISLWVGVISAYVFAFTWALPAAFNWIFFSISVYSFFMVWYYGPRLSWSPPEWNFGKRGQASRPTVFDTGHTPDPKRTITVISFIIFGLFIFFFFVGIFSSEETTSVYDASAYERFLNNPTDLDATTNLGNDFYAMQQYDSADYYYDRALRIDPGNAAASYNKGLIQYELKNYDEAFPFFVTAQEGGIRDPFLSHVLGFLYDNKGNTVKAIEFYKDAVQQDSTRADIYERLAELEPSRMLFYKGLAEKWKN